MIKFRAWDTEQEEYVFIHTLQELCWADYDYHPEDLIFEQFTTQVDIKGTDIYAGDIVNGGCYNGSYRLGVVTWVGDAFLALPIGKFAEGCCRAWASIQIVGNIRENPELLV